MRKLLAKLFGVKTLDDYVKKCVIKPKYVKK
jgi:hypothetical protein